jgi:hypothetical protein
MTETSVLANGLTGDPAVDGVIALVMLIGAVVGWLLLRE